MGKVISWDHYFMGVAKLSAMRSKDPNTQVGCCIVNQSKRIVAVGYNGLPYGLKDENYPWDVRNGEVNEAKYGYVVHAELNAILSSTASLVGSTLYVSLFPCNECAKAIIQAGVKEICYLDDKYNGTPADIASKRMLDDANIKYRKLESFDELIIK